MGETHILNKQKTGFQPSICVNVHPDNHTEGSETSKEDKFNMPKNTSPNILHFPVYRQE
jgi:hypothetical protein